MIEKLNSWSDTGGGNIERARSKDELPTNIMTCVVTCTLNTASWIYYGRGEEGGCILSPAGRSVEVPTACALFPREMPAWVPRSHVDRVCNA